MSSYQWKAWYSESRPDISDMIGLTFRSVYKQENQDGDDDLVFEVDDNTAFKLHHFRDCCESVHIEDICGDLSDLVDCPLLSAQEVGSDDEGFEELGALNKWDESFTWTFYHFRTNKGTVTVRWYGSSNGYYSESVSLVGTDGWDDFIKETK